MGTKSLYAGTETLNSKVFMGVNDSPVSKELRTLFVALLSIFDDF
jgi:hypothetical protein